MVFTSKTYSITFKDDIIKEMSIELDIPESELKEIIDLNIKYIKKSVIEKDILLINLPNLCKIRLNYKLSLGSASSTSSNNPRINSLRSKVKLLNEYRLRKDKCKLMSFKNPLFERLWRKSKRIKYNKNTYKKMYEMIRELEDETNKIIEEIE